MDPLTIMMITSAARQQAGEARSALPDAPVVGVARRESAVVATRGAAAAALRQLADAIAPRPGQPACDH